MKSYTLATLQTLQRCQLCRSLPYVYMTHMTTRVGSLLFRLCARGRHGRRQQGVWLFGVFKCSRREQNKCEFSCLRKLQHAAHECDRVRGEKERQREREGQLKCARGQSFCCRWLWLWPGIVGPSSILVILSDVSVSLCVSYLPLSPLPSLTPPPAVLSVCAPRRSESLHFIFVYHLFTTQFFYYFSRARLPRWGQLISYAK